MSEGKVKGSSMGWKEFYLKEDWWAVWLSFLIIFSAFFAFKSGTSLKFIAIKPAKWATFGQLIQDLTAHWSNYLINFVVWLVIFTISTAIMGFKVSEFVPSFIFVYVFSVIIFIIGAWEKAHNYNLEPPLVALALGMLISNIFRLPKWMDTGFRVEYYIKTGIVLLGATLPFTLIIWAGPIAFIQATIVAVTTFLTIYFASTKLFGLDRRLGATLGAGGAVCGVSASIAIAGAVKAKKEHLPIAITLVIIWAIVMIFFLPLVARLLHLHAGIAGAWIGTSEFADAAGFAAAQAYGALAQHLPHIPGTEEDAVWAFTLMKVVGRDIWIGVWAFVMALVSTMKWEVEESGVRPSPAEIWWRFPKFVLGFFVASLFMTAVTAGADLMTYKNVIKPMLVAPIKTMRTWAFIFCFFSIGLTTRFRELSKTGSKPFWAFTIGVVVNVVLGFILSTKVFGHYWTHLHMGK
ncbi:MAG: putative sulfate exporter family transporter [Thermodesulfobacteria bacterium]|nr:putative sulfate exporter family transporter [Thermodesulfobacteriota bacterium]